MIGYCRECAAEEGEQHPQIICNEEKMLCCRHERKRIYKQKVERSQNNPKKKITISFGYTNELEMFKDIWISRPHVSELSGRPLSYFSVANFAHILPKKRYPGYRLNPDNIILLHIEEHTLFDNGTKNQRAEYAKRYPAKWEMLYELREVLKKEYREYINNFGT